MPPAPLPFPAWVVDPTLRPPLAPGSGKFATPWLRMHSEYRRSPDAGPLVELAGPELGVEHAAQPIATTAVAITAASKPGDRRHGPASRMLRGALGPCGPASPAARCMSF